MKEKRSIIILALLFLATLTNCVAPSPTMTPLPVSTMAPTATPPSTSTEVVLTGDYMGQTPPGSTPEVFAPGVVSTDHHEHSSPTFSPDGKEIYWSRFDDPQSENPVQQILFARYQDGHWTEPQVAPFSGKYSDGGPCFSLDGRRLYFYSERPSFGDGGVLKDDVWVVERTDTGWSEAQNIGLSSLSAREKWIFSPSVTKEENLYVTGSLNGHGIFVVKKEGEIFLAPEALEGSINSGYVDFNWTPFVAPDASYLIVSSKRSDSHGFNDLYISFRQDDGTWGEPRNMGTAINNGQQVRFPSVSPDGKYLFFVRSTINGYDDVFWMSSEIIEQLESRDE
jgi:hypothetical protein